MSQQQQIANVYKSNALIESSYRLGVVEQRIILSCLSQLRKDQVLSDDELYTVSARTLGALTETESKSLYSEVAAAAQRLRRKDVTITLAPNGEGKLKQVMETSWVQSCVYIESEGCVRLRFNRDMVPYLTELKKQFTSYPLAEVIRMTSQHAIRLFELVMQYSSIGRRDISVDDFRKWFRLEDSYPMTNDLKRKVIEPAVAQINEFSSLVCKMTPVKSGRKVTHFRFTFAMKKGALISKKESDIDGALNEIIKPKKTTVTNADVERFARPGESYEMAKGRLENLLKREGALV